MSRGEGDAYLIGSVIPPLLVIWVVKDELEEDLLIFNNLTH